MTRKPLDFRLFMALMVLGIVSLIVVLTLGIALTS